MTIKYTLVVAEDGSVTGTKTSGTVLDTVIEAATLPLGFTAADNEVVSKKTAAYSVLGYATAGFFLGEALGHKRERAGAKSFVPLFRNA